MRIYEGSTEVILDSLAKQLTKDIGKIYKMVPLNGLRSGSGSGTSGVFWLRDRLGDVAPYAASALSSPEDA